MVAAMTVFCLTGLLVIRLMERSTRELRSVTIRYLVCRIPIRAALRSEVLTGRVPMVTRIATEIARNIIMLALSRQRQAI